MPVKCCVFNSISKNGYFQGDWWTRATLSLYEFIVELHFIGIYARKILALWIVIKSRSFGGFHFIVRHFTGVGVVLSNRWDFASTHLRYFWLNYFFSNRSKISEIGHIISIIRVSVFQRTFCCRVWIARQGTDSQIICKQLDNRNIAMTNESFHMQKPLLHGVDISFL